MSSRPSDLPVEVEVLPARHLLPGALRLVVTLYAPGCGYARGRHGGCTFCGFWDMTAQGEPVAADDLVRQFETALARTATHRDRLVAVDLYNSGSFLNPAEIPGEAQRALLELAAALPAVERVMVESRPEHILTSAPRLGDLRDLLVKADLEIGIGLETADDRIRLDTLRKGFSLADFEAACQVLADAGCPLRAYVLLKPPGLEEREAVEDVRKTAEYLEALSGRLRLPVHLALQAMFVPRGSALEPLFERGEYRPPTLWSVVDAVSACHGRVPTTVGLSDEGLADGRTPANCGLCDAAVRAALARYNATGDAEALVGLECSCREPAG